MVTDILLDENKDLMIMQGDFTAGLSRFQHQALLLTAEKGEFKHNTTVGYPLAQLLNDEQIFNPTFEIKREFERDGMKASSVAIVNDKIQTDAYYPL